MKKIIKVQRPLSGGQDWLAYDKSRLRVMFFQPDYATKQAMGDDYKAFFEANWFHGKWHIGNKTTWQDW